MSSRRNVAVSAPSVILTKAKDENLSAPAVCSFVIFEPSKQKTPLAGVKNSLQRE
jgi:hypothetical protein